MPVRTFDFCALQFLNQWLEKEAAYCQAIASEQVECRRQALVASSGHFRIARNLPTKFEQNGRFQAVLDAVDVIDHVTSENVVHIVAAVQQRISEAYGGRNVLSAATKFLWLKIKSPVRIYDRQARNALGTNENDFPAFNAAFSAYYARVKDKIEQACSKLGGVISYAVTPDIAERELKELVSTEWFRERVLDIYLWNEGNA